MCSAMTDGRARRACWLGAGATLVAATFVTPPARAQDIQLTGPLAGAPAVSSSRSSKRDSRIVMPSGHLEVAGEMAFLMSQASPNAERLALTDLALFRLNLRRSFADWLELYAGVDLLPKQPTSTDAAVFQGAHVGAQAEFAKGFGAALGVGAGPLFGADGVFYRTGPGLSWKPSVSEYLRFVVAAGNAWTILDYRGTTSSAARPALRFGSVKSSRTARRKSAMTMRRCGWEWIMRCRLPAGRVPRRPIPSAAT
jgi:hypothetical protein